MSKNKNNENENLINPKSLVSFIVGLAVGLFICFLISGDEESFIDIDDKLISNATASQMITNFISNNESDADTTISGHIELDVLLSFIDKMSIQCQEVGKDLSGLEYYFAKYLEGDDQAGQRTIVIYPTYKDSVSANEIYHIPFDPFSNMDVVRMNSGGARTPATDVIRCVLDKSNMSPPRGSTF